MRKRKTVKDLLLLTCFIVLVSLLPIVLMSCSGLVIGSGTLASEERTVSNFSSVSIGSSMNLILEQGENESVRIEAAGNIIPYVLTEARDGELVIFFKTAMLINLRPVNCYVTVKDLNKIKVSSSATVKCKDLKVESLTVEMASSSNGDLNVDVKMLEINVSSSASLTISGKAETQEIKVASSGKLMAGDLASKNCKITANSSSYAIINVSENLDALVNSSAKVDYKGSPEVSSQINSSGSLNKVGD